MQNDLISRSALIAYVKELPTYDPTNKGFIFKRYPSGLFAPDDIVKSIQNAPAVDAVEVVRCKDCKCWKHEYDDEGLCLTDVAPVDGDVGSVRRQANDFCSYGDRRTENG